MPKGTLVVPLHALPSRDWFTRFVRIVARHYRFVSAADLDRMLHGGPTLDGCCHLTFDDGHETFYSDAMPVLMDAAIPVTLFVSPMAMKTSTNYWFQDLASLRARLGDDAIRDMMCELFGCRREQIASFAVPLLALCMTRDDIQRLIDSLKRRHSVCSDARMNMTADMLREVAQSPLVTVGGHTMSHPVLANESDARARQEIQESIAELSDMIGRPVTTFAYPNGTEGLDFTGREQRVLQETGVTLAVSTDAGMCGPQTNSLAIPRGGYPSLENETSARTRARLLFPSLYDRVRRLAGRSDIAGAEQRRAIYALGCFPTYSPVSKN